MNITIKGIACQLWLILVIQLLFRISYTNTQNHTLQTSLHVSVCETTLTVHMNLIITILTLKANLVLPRKILFLLYKRRLF